MASSQQYAPVHIGVEFSNEVARREAEQQRAQGLRQKQALVLQKENILSQRTSNPARRNALEAALEQIEAQIAELRPFLEQNWRANISPKSGMPIYERPVALVLYRDDHRFLLDSIIPRAGRTEANFDLVIASQPYRAKSSVNFRAKRIIAPLARGLRPGGRLIGIHSHGQDPGMEIIQAVWPGENPFSVSRHELLRAVKYELGSAGRDLNFNAYADNRSVFRYDMEALPNEVTGAIGTSTAFAAWNAAVYVAQIEDDRLTEMTESGRTLDAARDVLRKHNGLWFYDESYVISRRRD